MINPQTRAAIEAVPLPALLPPRKQARAESLNGRAGILDAVDLGATANGGVAWILVLSVETASGNRDVVVPGVMRKSAFVRDPSVAANLRSGNFGNFTLEVFGGSIPADPVRVVDVDQSNDSVVMGSGHSAVMVKWQVDAVESPAPQRLMSLAGTGITPDVRAIVRWRDEAGIERTLLTAANYLPGAEDGWTWAVDLIREHALGANVDSIEPFAVLGEMTARMHLAFIASRPDSVQQWDRLAISELHASCRADLDEAVRVIDGQEGVRLRARQSAMAQQIDTLASIDSTPTIDIHGDLHIGQVLRVGDDGGTRYAFVDFDGNPVLAPAQRMRRQPAARDVAGMLASIDHVARVVNYRTQGLDPRPAAIWAAHAQDAFLAAYQSTLTAAGLRSVLDDRLIRPLIVDQECREFVYSARHLPHWRYVPDAVLTAMFPEQGDG